MAESNGDGDHVVHVAVGKSVKKMVCLLKWTFANFKPQNVCLVHVHRPARHIPTLLGRLPASQANPETVAAFRSDEKEEMTKLLSNYLTTCSKNNVRASIISTEGDDIQKEIVKLLNIHNIRKLVVGATPDGVKGTKVSHKARYAAKHAPPYCELWFVNKGKLIHRRQASETPSSVLPIRETAAPTYTLNLKSRSLDLDKNGVSSFEQQTSSFSSTESVEHCLNIQLAELKLEVDESKDIVLLKLLEHKNMQADAMETFRKVEAMEMAHSREVKLRTDAEDALKIMIQEQEKMLEVKEKISQQLQKTMLNIALLDSRVQEANRRREEVAVELKLIQASIATLRQEKHNLQWQKIEATRWLDRWKSHDQYEDANEGKFIGSTEDLSEVPVFLLSDLETATCNFSESFRIGNGGHGIVYKGEMLSRTVAIKKLHLYNMHRHIEFQKAVQVLGKLHHPHLVELIGVCPESWSLVYEYLPGGNLENYIFNNNGICAINWKIRARIVADIASGLLFLHSSRPKKIVHGNLKPENVLLDCEHRCKLSDYAGHLLLGSHTMRCPSFRHCNAPSGAFSYTDPESHRTGAITHKSDIYSFGLIILELVTGKTWGGLTGKLRRAVSNGELTSMLDLSAGEWSTYVARRLIELGLQCCEPNSRDRPELTPSLVKELERLPVLEDQTVPSFFLCPILQEIMHDPHVAADGFTYEGEAMRGWLESGHQTSPMTNLKLNHLTLTPNIAMKLAIQDWICKA